MIAWTKTLPTESGTYLRATSWGTTSECCVHEDNDELMVDFAGGVIFVKDLSGRGFWWLGPLPSVPKE